MKKSIHIIAALCALVLCSCTKEQPLSSEGSGTPLVFKAHIGDYSLKAGLDMDNFNIGDKIGLFASFNSSYDEYNTCMTAVRDAATFEADHDIYWNDWNVSSDEQRGWAYFPYDASRTLPGEKGWDVFVNSDQSTDEKYIASDFRAAEFNLSPLKGEVDMFFEHLFSKVLFHITNESGKQISDVYFSNVFGKAVFYPAYIEESYGSTGTIKACRFADGENGEQQWAVIIPPQSCSPELIITTSDRKQFTFKIENTEYFYSGSQRNCYITLTEDTAVAEFSDEVTSWSDDKFYNFDNNDRIILDISDSALLEKLTSLGYDANADGRISKAEALKCRSLDLSGAYVYEIDGLQQFDNLRTLILDGTYVGLRMIAFLPKNLESLSVNGCVNIGPVLDFDFYDYAYRLKNLSARSCPGLQYLNAGEFSKDCMIDVTDSPVSHVVAPDGLTLVQNSNAVQRSLIWTLCVYAPGADTAAFYPLEPSNGNMAYWIGTVNLSAGDMAAFVPNFSEAIQTICPSSSDGSWPVNVWCSLTSGFCNISRTGSYELQLDFSDNSCYTHFETSGFDSILGVWHAEANDYFNNEPWSWDMRIENGQDGLLVYNVEPFVGSYGYEGPFKCEFDGVNLIIPNLQFMGENGSTNIYLSGVNGDIVMTLNPDGTLVLQSYIASADGVEDGSGNVTTSGYYYAFAPGVIFNKK